MKPLSHGHKTLQRALRRILMWLVLEIVLEACGLDTVADWGEWVFERNKGASNDCNSIALRIL